MKEKVEDNKKKDASPTKQPKITLSRFFDVNEPWVLVPNGSFMGYFNNVPRQFRVGPWLNICCVYIVVLMSFMLRECAKCYLNPPQTSPSYFAYFGTDTWQWKYNAAAFMFTLYVCYRTAVTPTGFGSWSTYTVQSWTIITIRHGLSAVAPFVPQAAVYNEYLRFPMLLQTTIVFGLWNFALFPAIAMTMKTPKHRQGFIKFCLGFELFSMHVINLPLAVINGVYASPMRELNQLDFCVALLSTLQYILFYLLILDRLGIHLYFIFSPRSHLALASWTTFIGLIYAGFALWKNGILDYGIAL